MDNKQFSITVASIIFGLLCLVWAILVGIMARDLRDSVIILEKEKGSLEQQIIELEWMLEEVDQMICIKE